MSNKKPTPKPKQQPQEQGIAVTPDELYASIGKAQVENVKLRSIIGMQSQRIRELETELEKATKKPPRGKPQLKDVNQENKDGKDS